MRQNVGDLPIVAIGGIDLDRIADVLSAGADSVAMISSLLVGNAAGIVENMRAAAEIARNVKH